MLTNRLILPILVLVCAVLIAWMTYRHRREITPEQLAVRTATSRPEWANYDEDIKAQIGARPVAEWRGRPVSARLEGPEFQVTFELAGPWAERGAALPVLLRHPLGAIYRSEDAARDGARVTYFFTIPHNDDEGPLPWVEIKCPHREHRLTLSASGLWAAPE